MNNMLWLDEGKEDKDLRGRGRGRGKEREGERMQIEEEEGEGGREGGRKQHTMTIPVQPTGNARLVQVILGTVHSIPLESLLLPSSLQYIIK